MLDDLKGRLAKVKDFFEDNGSFVNVDTIELPDISHYPQPEVPSRLEQKVSRLQQSVRHVEKVAKKAPVSDFDENKKYKVDYRGELNKAQFQAATKLGGPILVIAGAGSGKTRVIVYRVSFLLENNVAPERILLLTFTRKAAGEMLGRVAKLTKNQLSSKVMGGTFHSFASAILRRYGKMVGIEPNFTIADSGDSADAINIVRTQLGIKKSKDSLFPNKSRLQSIISAGRNKQKSIAVILETEHPRYIDHAAAIQKIAEGYKAYKRRANILDYDDLLEVLRDKLRESDAFRSKIQQLFDYVLVDEYQDTNLVQGELLKLLAGRHNNIFVVGDDAQSIYAFRGANFENILRFPREFADATIILMEDNYRSAQEVLDFSNEVINNAFLGYKKHLRAQSSAGFLPQALKFYNEQEEASFIADTMEERFSRGLKLKNMAVLYRSSYHGNFLQVELNRRNIPFITVGGIKFIERKHVRDVMAYLRVSVNNHDSIAWSRILLMLPGVGETSAGRIINEIQERRFNLTDYADKKYTRELVELFEVLSEVKQAVSPEPKLELIFEHYFPFLEKTEEDADIRKLDLQALKKLAEGYKTIDGFINDFSLDPPNQAFQDKHIDISDEIDDYVTLTTVHSAKGLEWNTVFIIHALEGLFPSHRSVHTIDELDEERRLFYVAATRAKERLFVTMPSYSAGYDAYFSLPSRFLVEACQKSRLIDFKVSKGGGQHIGMQLQPADGRPMANDEPRYVPEIAAGDKVRHESFGEGTVVHIEDEVAIIDFGSKGPKKLNIAFAPLEKL